MNYSKPFYLEGKGNAAFAAGSRLYVPSVIEGSVEDVSVGEEVVFVDHDEHDILQQCIGLKKFVKFSWKGVPCVVVDNHNHVLFFWYEALAAGLLKPGASLVHVDQHKDMRRPEKALKSANLEEVFRYTNEDVNVGNYIVPAVEQGLLEHVQLITGEMHLDDRRLVGKGNKILNIDLDFFAPELNYIDFEKTREFIETHLEDADLVTFATSPFFIDQELAIDYLKRLVC